MRRATVSEAPSSMMQNLNYVPFRQRNNQLSPKYSISSKGSMFSFKSPQHIQKKKILSNAKSQPTIVTLVHLKESIQKQQSESSKQDFIIQKNHERIDQQNTQKETQIVNNLQIEFNRKIEQNVTQITQQLQENKMDEHFQQEQKKSNQRDFQQQDWQVQVGQFIEELEPIQMLPEQIKTQQVKKKPQKVSGKFSSPLKFSNKNNFFKKLQTTTKKTIKPKQQVSNPESKLKNVVSAEKLKQEEKQSKKGYDKFQEIMKNLKNGNKAASSKFNSQFQSSEDKKSKLLKRFKKKNQE